MSVFGPYTWITEVFKITCYFLCTGFFGNWRKNTKKHVFFGFFRIFDVFYGFFVISVFWKDTFFKKPFLKTRFFHVFFGFFRTFFGQNRKSAKKGQKWGKNGEKHRKRAKKRYFWEYVILEFSKMRCLYENGNKSVFSLNVKKMVFEEKYHYIFGLER